MFTSKCILFSFQAWFYYVSNRLIRRLIIYIIKEDGNKRKTGKSKAYQTKDEETKEEHLEAPQWYKNLTSEVEKRIAKEVNSILQHERDKLQGTIS